MPWLVLLFSLLGFCPAGKCQSGIPIGAWKSYLPLQQGKTLTQSISKIIYGTPGSLIFIDKEDQSTEFVSKVEGLSDIGIQKIKFDPVNNQLIVAYTNGNLDILRGNEVINLPQIKENRSLGGDKSINEIYIDESGQIFLSSSFGLVSIRGSSLEFGNSLFSGGLRIWDFIVYKEKAYLASEDGLYLFDEGVNFSDFSQWKLLGQESGLPIAYSADQIESFENKLYLSLDNRIYSYNEDTDMFEIFYEDKNPDFTIKFLRSSGNYLVAGFAGKNFQSSVLFFDSSGKSFVQGNFCSDLALDALVDEKNRVWYADGFGDIRLSSGPVEDCERRQYDSPYSQLVSDISTKDELVLAASGGVSESFLYLYGREGFYFLHDKRWQNFNEYLNPSIQTLDLLSVFRVLLHPSEKKLYAGSYWAGLLEYDYEKEEYQLFNKTNSSLRGAIGDEARERITGMVFDQDGNLWISTYGAARPLNVLTKEGKWMSFQVQSPTSLSNISIDNRGVLWIPVFGNNGGVLIYDPGEDPLNASDDRQRYITAANSSLTTNLVNDVLTDRDGAVWVGTAEGPVVFDCGSKVLDSSCSGVRKKVLQDSIAAFLLADQEILCMARDGGNQKWFGTRNGLFVQSPEGTEQIAHFTSNNSPLFDNQILALSYNGRSGEMFIGTNKGLMSYRSPSSNPEPIHREDRVIVFPNPVPPEYKDLIAIKGLVPEADVKITNINGRLIRHLRSLGGTAVWDGKDSQGRDVNTGVYLVFSSSTDPFEKPDAFVTKIMILRN